MYVKKKGAAKKQAEGKKGKGKKKKTIASSESDEAEKEASAFGPRETRSCARLSFFGAPECE